MTIVTLFAAGMLAFPYYAHVFYPETEKQVLIVDKSNVKTVEFTISEMTCTGCEEHVKHEVNKLNGIVKVNASVKKGNAVVIFDQSAITIDKIEATINATGYKVIGKKGV